ncbi:MAG: T9SS type A sorting domain-containing protein [Bacteroidetes bacterium]|nr:T9SS type A sorting domain-containing protein [Bacteroidota bacterium]
MKKIILFLILFIISSFLINELTAQTGSLEGTVSCSNGQPIEDAIIDVGGIFYDTTDANGYYEFPGLPVGTWNVTCIIEGYDPFINLVEIIENQTATGNFSVPCPEFMVDPLNIQVTLGPNTSTTVIITLSNPGQGSVDWSANLEILTNNAMEDFLDVQFQYPVTGATGKVGIECDGEYFYVTNFNNGIISKYALDGTFIGTLSIVVPGLRDLAYDGTYFYGGNGSPVIYEMDFYAQTLVSTITTPQIVRAIAYNDDEDIFYGYSWGGDIIAFDRSGALIAAAPVGPSGANYSGFAYDNVSDGSPYLWGYGMVGTNPNVLVQLDLPTMQGTGFMVCLDSLLPEPLTNGAGGLFTQPDIIPGTWTLGGIVTDEWIWGLELAEYQTWISIDPTSGTLEPGESEEMTVYFDATNIFTSINEAEIHFSTLPNVGSPVVLVEMLVAGFPFVYALEAEVNCTDIILEWQTIPPGTPADSFRVYKDSTWIATTFETSYVDSLIFPETEHFYFVNGYFLNGIISNSSNTEYVTVPLPDSLEPQNLDYTISGDLITIFWNSPAACIDPLGYNVYRNNTLLGFITDTTFTDVFGYYQYCVTAVYYFGESGPSNSIIITGLKENAASSINIFPNPAQDKIFIKSGYALKAVELLNNIGKVVLAEEVNTMNYKINVSKSESGIYYVKLETEEGIIIRKIVVK